MSPKYLSQLFLYFQHLKCYPGQGTRPVILWPSPVSAHCLSALRSGPHTVIIYLFTLIMFPLTILSWLLTTCGGKAKFSYYLLKPFWSGTTYISIPISCPVLWAKFLAMPTLAICPMDAPDSFPAWRTSPPLPSAEFLKTPFKCHILCEVFLCLSRQK